MSKKHTLEEIKNFIEQFDYKLLSTTYFSAFQKLEIECSKDHIFEMRYNDFQQGCRCPECMGKKRYSVNNIKEYVEKFKYKLLSTEYKNSHSKLELQCSKSHIFQMSYHHFQQGQRCPICFGTPKKTLEDVREYIESFDYKLLSTEYISNKEKLKLQCPKGHIFYTTYNHFQRNIRCSKCSFIDGKSKPEKEIVEYIKKYYFGDIVENDRIICKNYWSGYGLELDIYLPDLSKAIEYNGSYWHSSSKTKWYDEMKKKQCILKGIELLVIQEQDWYSDKNKCLNKINLLVRD